MSLLWFTVTNLLIPLIVWSAIFVGAALIVAVPVARWGMRKVRSANPAKPLPAAAVWLLRAWNIVVLYILCAGIAWFHAIPFAASRGLAQIIEQSGPETTRWVTQWIVDNAALLGLPPETTRTLVNAGSSAVLSDFVTSLHLAAWGQLISAVLLVLACHGATVLLFLGYAVFLAKESNRRSLPGVQHSDR